MERMIGTGEICRLLNVTRRTICRWVKAGVIHPAQAANRTGERHLFRIVEVLAIALARDLKRKGFSLPQAGAALNIFWGRTLAELENEWALGRTHLLCVGTKPPCPWMFAPGDIPQAELASAAELGIRCAVIDVQAAYRHLAATLEANEEARRIAASARANRTAEAHA